MFPFPLGSGVMGGGVGPAAGASPLGLQGGLIKAIQAAMEGKPTGGLMKQISELGAPAAPSMTMGSGPVGAPGPTKLPGLLGMLMGLGGGTPPATGGGGLSGLY